MPPCNNVVLCRQWMSGWKADTEKAPARQHTIQIRPYCRGLTVYQFKCVRQTLLRPTPVATVTKICELQYKIGYKSACVRDNPDTCTHWGVVRVTQFNDVLNMTSSTNPCCRGNQMIVFEQKVVFCLAYIKYIAQNRASYGGSQRQPIKWCHWYLP